MNAALAWCLLAAALMLLGSPGRSRRAAVGSRVEPMRRGPSAAGGLSVRSQRTIAIAGVAVAALALAGPIAGGVVAVVSAPITSVVLRRLAGRPSRASPDPSLALALDLTAAMLRAGQPAASALHLAAPVLHGAAARQWRRVAGLLGLGADPEQAWAAVSDAAGLGPVAVAARRSAHSGARLAQAFEQLAAETRSARRAEAVSRANRAGVLAVLPLGLCFLPAFVCLGIVPTIVGIASGALGMMR